MVESVGFHFFEHTVVIRFKFLELKCVGMETERLSKVYRSRGGGRRVPRMLGKLPCFDCVRVQSQTARIVVDQSVLNLFDANSKFLTNFTIRPANRPTQKV